jgi:hypothetical protein
MLLKSQRKRIPHLSAKSTASHPFHTLYH